MIMLVQDPQRFDVIVTDNLFGDIITDLAAAVTGGIGLAASANINPTGAFPSMFEPVHGSAPDIAGQGIADPTATISSMALLLDHLGRPAEAAAIERAVDADVAQRGTAARSTSQIGDAIAARVAGLTLAGHAVHPCAGEPPSGVVAASRGAHNRAGAPNTFALIHHDASTRTAATSPITRPVLIMALFEVSS